MGRGTAGAQADGVIAADPTPYAGYLALQAAGGVVLWVAIVVSGTVRSWFELRPDVPDVTDAFFLPDMIVVAVSAMAAWSARRRSRAALPLASIALGGVLYPTAYLFSWVTASEGDGFVALAVMLVVSALCAWAVVGLWRLDRGADDRAAVDAPRN
jgi:hypothetical protein